MAAGISTIFFDLGDTLGKAVLSPEPVHLVGFTVFPFVPALLEDLQDRGIRLGIISNTGDDNGLKVDEILAAAGIRRFFEDALRLYSKDIGLSKNSEQIFRLAAGRAGVATNACMFVGEDDQERNYAQGAGMCVASDPLGAAELLDG